MFLLIALLSTKIQGSYDPMKVEYFRPKIVDLIVKDNKRNRDIPIKAYLPKQSGPIVIFSHGLGGNREGNPFMGEHWANRGYVAVFMQHPGSDDSVWKNTPMLQRMAAMKRAASGQNFMLRTADVPAVVDQLTIWNQDKGSPLFQRMDMQHIGMSGHSFGAVTTQAVSGQSYGGLGARFTDPRIDAAVAFSPDNPNPGRGKETFGNVKIPWLLMTGTKDTAAVGTATVESRLDVFPHLPSSIDRFELVLHNAEHSAFTDRALPGDRETRNPNHHRAILALSTAFWDTYLRGDRAAKAWLKGSGAKGVLEANDKWEVRSKK